MFEKIILKNYRAHRFTEIHLDSVTLLIGNNNSGKTNLLAGIQHFAQLVKQGDPDIKLTSRSILSEDYFSHCY